MLLLSTFLMQLMLERESDQMAVGQLSLDVNLVCRRKLLLYRLSAIFARIFLGMEWPFLSVLR